jgi:hypothetical protein
VNLRRLHLKLILILVSSLFVSTFTTSAQTPTPVCTNIVNQTITQTGVNCADRVTGTACYAAEEVDSNLAPNVNPADFDTPGDRVSLQNVVHLRPQALSLTDQTWGITTLNLQASLPTRLAQDVVVLGLGGAELENGVMPEAAFTPPSASVSATTTSATALRMPTMNPASAEVIAQVPNGATVSADVVSSDRQWVRVIYGNIPGWLAASALSADVVSRLPVLDGLTPMQSFFVRTGIDGQPCVNAPSWVIVQGPQDIAVELVVNTVDLRLQSTMLLRTIRAGEPVGLQMEIIVLFGLVTINPESNNPIYVPPGYSVLVNLGDELISLGIEGDADERAVRSFGTPRLLTQGEIDALGILRLLPNNIINYPIELPQIIQASNVSGIITRIIFRNPRAVALVQRFCAEDRLPDAICEAFGF